MTQRALQARNTWGPATTQGTVCCRRGLTEDELKLAHELEPAEDELELAGPQHAHQQAAIHRPCITASQDGRLSVQLWGERRRAGRSEFAKVWTQCSLVPRTWRGTDV
jgi:hypothetical protein